MPNRPMELDRLRSVNFLLNVFSTRRNRLNEFMSIVVKTSGHGAQMFFFFTTCRNTLWQTTYLIFDWSTNLLKSIWRHLRPMFGPRSALTSENRKSFSRTPHRSSNAPRDGETGDRPWWNGYCARTSENSIVWVSGFDRVQLLGNLINGPPTEVQTRWNSE